MQGAKSILQTAGLYHLISEFSFVKGDTHETVSNAKEAFQLRARLFKYVFHNSGKSASGLRSNATSNTAGSVEPNILQRYFQHIRKWRTPNILQLREHTGPLATWSWPFFVKVKCCLSHPSQLRILGDYVECLMQVRNIFHILLSRYY